MNKRRLCDLHIHSTASDGMKNPSEVVRLAELAGLFAVALTDHDTLAGIAEAAKAARQYPDLQFVPGIEFSAECSYGEMHILGLHIDPAAESVTAMADHMAAGRVARNAEMIERMRRSGMEIDPGELRGGTKSSEEAGGAGGAGGVAGVAGVGRAHFARWLVRRGHARSEPDAFNRYLAKGRDFYIPRVRASSSDIIAAIKNSGGLALLAHPVHLNYENYAQCERIVRDLIDKGLDGLEVYHSHHNDQQSRYFMDLARKWNLVTSGGSDFHGRYHERIGGIKTPAIVAEKLRQRISN